MGETSTVGPLFFNTDNILQPISDAAFAEELQLEEVLRASNLPLQATPLDLSEELLQLQEPLNMSFLAPDHVPSFQHQGSFGTARGEPSLSFCEICRCKRENQLMASNKMCVDCAWYLMDEDLVNVGADFTSSSRGCDEWPDHQSFSPLNTWKDNFEINEDEAMPDCDANMFDEIDFEDFDGDIDDYDSDISLKSPETLKNSSRFRKFFEGLEGVNIKEIERGSSWWHCPACQGAPGGTTRFHCLEDLLKHAKTIGSRRVKLHRNFAELLNKELRNKLGTPFGSPGGGTPGKWMGLEDEKDFEIVWPPVVMILNTHAYQENNKWIGMGNEELLKRFRSYNVVKALNAYGPGGHRGMGTLIFEGSAAGYLEAKYLHELFEQQGKGRIAYNSSSATVLPPGQRQLYGFMATKEELNEFNRHNRGKYKVKYEIKTYKEAMVDPVRKMSEDSRELTQAKGNLEKEETEVRSLKALVHTLNRKLQQNTTDNTILIKKMNLLHQETREELDFQEKYFKEQISVLEAKLPKQDYDESDEKHCLPTEEEEEEELKYE